MSTRTPFGNPDGSRSDIQEVVENFVTFEELSDSTGLGIRPDDLSIRVIVGAKGSGKTVYLRRLRAAAANNESIYADVVQQDLPVTSNIVKFCQCFSKRDLTEKWMQLWYCAIVRSLVTHLLNAKSLAKNLTDEQRAELEDFPSDFVPRRRREVSVYSQITDIIQRYHTAHAYSTFFDHPEWAELSTTISDIMSTMPPIYLFVDSVDEEYASAPMYWLQCQKGLFFRTMRFLRDQHFGGRLHVIVCVRDHVFASVLRSEHQNRYRGEPHIISLGWEYPSAEYFLAEKIARLPRELLINEPDDDRPSVEDWLGHSFVDNRGRHVREPCLQYLLRHTRLLPRDIVILGNRLCEAVQSAKRNGHRELPPEAIRLVVREVSRSFGDEQLSISANHLASSGMPADAARMEYDEIYTGDTEYARSFHDHLLSVIQLIGKDRFGPDELDLAALHASEVFGEGSDALSVLWQNRLLGYVEETPDGLIEVFFSELNCDHFTLPRDKKEYVLHSSMIDCAGIEAVGSPVGQGWMSNPWSKLRSGSTSSRARARASGDSGHIGAYPILGVIGKGGMGTVYLAEDVRLKRRVAIKVLPEPRGSRTSALARFEREARVLAALDHPNIATVFTLEEDEGTHFLTMEYVVGENLAARVRQESLDAKTTLTLVRQIALALKAAFRKNVIHRDLKPSNVMVKPDNAVKVLDFGLAKVVAATSSSTASTRTYEEHRTASGAILGTVGYMSPEQIRGGVVDHRADIWAFGCCLYECLSGGGAFPGRTPLERMAATMERSPDWDAITDAPAEIRRLVKQCVEKDVDKRLSDISDAIGVIDSVRGG